MHIYKSSKIIINRIGAKMIIIENEKARLEEYKNTLTMIKERL